MSAQEESNNTLSSSSTVVWADGYVSGAWKLRIMYAPVTLSQGVQVEQKDSGKDSRTNL